MNQTYVLDASAVLNLIRGKELGRQIDHAYGLRAAIHRHTISIVTHAELRVLAERNSWGAPKKDALSAALDQLVTVNVDTQAIVDAYVRVAEASRSVPSGERRMGHNDMWIAATALVCGFPLITTDEDFNHLNPKLITVYWVDPRLGAIG